MIPPPEGGEPANVNRLAQSEPVGCGWLMWSRGRRWLLGAAVVCVVAVGAAQRIIHLANDPHVNFLSNDARAEWIRADVPFSLAVHSLAPSATVFQCAFSTTTATEHPQLTIRAFHKAAVTLDGMLIDPGSSDTDNWKKARTVSLPNPLSAGRHVLQITVSNQGAPPCLLAYCEDLRIRTGSGWESETESGSFVPVAVATEHRSPGLARQYPKVSEAFLAILPWLAGIFLLALVWTWWNSRPVADRADGGRWHVTPGRVRWLLLAAWVVLAANDMWRLAQGMGFDVQSHYQYVEFISQFRALPLATDGWQMFQPPLFYLSAVPWYVLLIKHFDAEVVVKSLRLLPLLCGLAQIEIVYRAARTVFPGKEDLQTIATSVGALLPMQIYISLLFGNEPLAGCLTAGIILMCFSLLIEPARPRRRRYFILMGGLWGLAVLSKLTPVLLAPLLVATVIYQSRLESRRAEDDTPRAFKSRLSVGPSLGTWGTGLARLGWLFGACFVTSGWYFLRNWTYLNKPVIFGGEPESGFVWWQDPGYRTWKQMTSFGRSLVRPVYSGAWSLWDSLYSSMWLDGTISGTISGPANVPWNLRWMEAGAWLALVPMGLLLGGVFSLWRKDLRQSRNALLFAVTAIAIYLAAIIDVYLRLPIYSTAKATYTVGLLPCYAVLIAAGAVPFVRFRLLRALVFAALTTWALAAYITFFAM